MKASNQDRSRSQGQNESKGELISRRGFIAAGCIAASMAGLGGFGALNEQADAAYLRPPGSQTNADLAARCNRCYRCEQACPYDIVTPIPLGENFVMAGTPTLDFTLGYCDWCMKCLEACPTGALRWGTPTESNIGIAKVLKDACVAWDWTGCTVCKDECPVEGAITLDENYRPIVHDDLCDGCGRCEQVCPSASLRAYDDSVEHRGIIVVSRESVLAKRADTLTSADMQDRYLKEEGAQNAQ